MKKVCRGERFVAKKKKKKIKYASTKPKLIIKVHVSVLKRTRPKILDQIKVTNCRVLSEIRDQGNESSIRHKTKN